MKDGLAYLALSIAALMLGSGAVWAQKVERFVPWDVGDKAVWKWVMSGKTQQLEEVFTQVSDTEIVGTQKAAGKEFQVAIAMPGFALTKGICITNGEPCVFSPGMQLLEAPLEKGKRWSTSFTATGTTFSSNVVQERQVDKVEKIRVPAGEFETYKVSVRGRINGVDPKGTAYSGKEEITEWWAFLSGKPKVIRVDYRNSFGEKASLELISLSIK